MKNLFNYDYYVGDCIYDFETDNNKKREEKKDQRQRQRKQRHHHNLKLPSLQQQQQQQKQYNGSLIRTTKNNNLSYRDFHSTAQKRINEIKNCRAAHSTKDYCNDDTIVNHLTALRRPAQKSKKKKNINEESVTQTITPTTILLPSIKSPYYDDYQIQRKTNSSSRNHTHKEEEEVYYQNIHKFKQPFTKKSSFENDINTTTTNRKNIIHTIDSKNIVKKLESLTLSTCDNNSNKSSPYHNNQQQFQSTYIVSKLKDNTPLSPKIQCTYCHFKVLQFIGKSWILPRTNYLFFRQYYPDTTKLSLYLSDEKDDCIAYCCQCTWMNFSSRLFYDNENCTNPTRMASSVLLQNVVSQKQKLYFIQRKGESSNRQQNNEESLSNKKKETIGGVAHSYSRLTWVVGDE